MSATIVAEVDDDAEATYAMNGCPPPAPLATAATVEAEAEDEGEECDDDDDDDDDTPVYTDRFELSPPLPPSWALLELPLPSSTYAPAFADQIFPFGGRPDGRPLTPDFPPRFEFSTTQLNPWSAKTITSLAVNPIAPNPFMCPLFIPRNIVTGRARWSAPPALGK
jgi:hypothetical protein